MYAHLIRKCHHQIVLEGFDEQMLCPSDNCCDVCAMPPIAFTDKSKELSLLISAIDELGTKREEKLVQFLRGSNEAWISELTNINIKTSSAYGLSPPNLSLEWWHWFARQCSVAGYLTKKVDCGTFHRRQAGVFSFFAVTDKGSDTIANKKDVLLPPLPIQVVDRVSHVTAKPDHFAIAQKKACRSWEQSIVYGQRATWRQRKLAKHCFKGPVSFPRSVTINSILFCKDISQLPQCVATTPHLLWEDIQLSKGIYSVSLILQSK